MASRLKADNEVQHLLLYLHKCCNKSIVEQNIASWLAAVFSTWQSWQLSGYQTKYVLIIMMFRLILDCSLSSTYLHYLKWYRLISNSTSCDWLRLESKLLAAWHCMTPLAIFGDSCWVYLRTNLYVDCKNSLLKAKYADMPPRVFIFLGTVSD